MHDTLEERLSQRLLQGLGALGVLLMLAHGIIVSSAATNIPYWDEWMLFRPNNLTFDLNFKWLMELHNEHRLVSTKLFAWVLYRTTGLNLQAEVFYNFCIFGFLGWLLLRLCQRATGERVSLAWVALASTLPHEIHYWSFQGHFHTYLIFFIWALFLILENGRASWLWPLCAAACAYCFSAGVPCVLTLFLVAGVWGYFRPEVRLRLSMQSALAAFLTATWFVGFEKNPGHPAFVLPHRALFWRTVFGAMGRGFGWGRRGVFVFGALVLMGLLVLGVREFLRVVRERAARPERLVLIAFVGANLLGVAQTALARAAFFPDAQATPSRYLETILVLAPALLALGLKELRGRPRTRLVFGLAVLAPFLARQNFVRAYEGYTAQMRANQECVRRNLLTDGPACCLAAYPDSLRPFLSLAKELRVGFVDTLLPSIYAAPMSFGIAAAQAEAKDEDCAIASINGRRETVAGMFSVAATEPNLAIEGRLALPGKSRVFPPDVSFLLESLSGDRYVLPAHRVPSGTTGTGQLLVGMREGPKFVARLEGTRPLSPGDYRVSIIYTLEGQEYRCATKKKLTLTPPDPRTR